MTRIVEIGALVMPGTLECGDPAAQVARIARLWLELHEVDSGLAYELADRLSEGQVWLETAAGGRAWLGGRRRNSGEDAPMI